MAYITLHISDITTVSCGVLNLYLQDAVDGLAGCNFMTSHNMGLTFPYSFIFETTVI